MNRLRKWFRNFPLVTRKRYIKEVTRQTLLKHKAQERHDKEMAEVISKLDPLVEKLINIEIEQPAELYGRYRLSMEFDEQFVYDTFLHGNDRWAINLVAASLAREIARELYTINFTRLGRIYRERAGIADNRR